MDEILLANFMLFHDVVRETIRPLDRRRGVGARPLPAREPRAEDGAVRLPDRLRRLAADRRLGRRRARRSSTADYNDENIEHVERYPYVRDAAVFVGAHEDVVPRQLRAGAPVHPGLDRAALRLPGLRPALRSRRVRGHRTRCGGSSGTDPNAAADRGERRRLGRRRAPAALGSPPASRSCEATSRRPRLLLVCGPRIDPTTIPAVDGMTAVGYVHDLFRTLACCDLAVVQGGLTTTMELVANRRPFVYSRSATTSSRTTTSSTGCGATARPSRRCTTKRHRHGSPQQMPDRLGAAVDYAAGRDRRRAAAAASLITPLLEERKGTRFGVVVPSC